MLAICARGNPVGARMDQDTIQILAQEIAQRLQIYSWQALVVHAVLVLLAFCGGMIFADSIRARAIKRGTDAPSQRRETMPVGPPLAEGWREREWANLRRTKLEVLIGSVNDCERFADQGAAGGADQRDPLSELHVITTLYFPELKAEVDRFLERCRGRRSSASLLEGVASETDTAAFKSARDQLNVAARKLTTRIMGVAE
jgi:hypothetical protein